MSFSNVDYDKIIKESSDLDKNPANAKDLGGITKPISPDTKAIHTAALNSSKASEEVDKNKNIFNTQKCTSDSKFYVTPMKDIFSSEGIELNKPTPNKQTPNNIPSDGASTISPIARGAICGTGVGVANVNLSFNCNFVIGVNLDSCLFKFKKIIEIQVKRLANYAIEMIMDAVPGISQIKEFVAFACRILNLLQKVVCFIQQLIACIMNSITAIINLITYILTLPLQLIQRLIGCVSNFFDNIVGSFGSLTGTLLSTFTAIFGCNPVVCNPINNITDIETSVDGIESAAYEVGNAGSVAFS